MANYKLLSKPTISNWPNVCRNWKFVLALCLLIVMTTFVITGTTRYMRLSKIYRVQSKLSDNIELRMEYLRRRAAMNEGKWLEVADLDGHIYSAYLDVRPEVMDLYSHKKGFIPWSLVRIIAILPMTTEPARIECILKFENEFDRYTYKRRPATSVKAIEDNWSLQYSAFFVLCDVDVPEIFDRDDTYNNVDLPISVAIGLATSKNLTFVDIHYPTMIINYLFEPSQFMAICVPVLHHSFDRPLDIVEFVEYYSLMGVNQFTFYNSSISSNVSKVLDYYVNGQVATVLSWKLPAKYVYEKTLRLEGVLASTNDCLYRNVFQEDFEYVANVGIDDFIVPRIETSFKYLIERLDPYKYQRDSRYASFLFKNVFFYTMYEDDGVVSKPYLYTQAKTRRLIEPQEAGLYSRYIVRGRDVVELGNYKVAEFREGSLAFAKRFHEMTVNEELALSHQYAPCEAEETGCYLKPTTIDKSAHKFTKELRTEVAAACKKIFGNGGCPFVPKEKLA